MLTRGRKSLALIHHMTYLAFDYRDIVTHLLFTHIDICWANKNIIFFIEHLQVLLFNHCATKKSRSRICWSLTNKEQNTTICFRAQSRNRSNRYNNFLQSLWWLDKKFILHCNYIPLKTISSPRLKRFSSSLQIALRFTERFKNFRPAFSLHLIVGVMIVMTLGATVTKSPACKFIGSPN